jgi:hypothetical protein
VARKGKYSLEFEEAATSMKIMNETPITKSKHQIYITNDHIFCPVQCAPRAHINGITTKIPMQEEGEPPSITA